MSRYFRARQSKPRADWIDDDYPMLPALTVDDHEATDTGLIDAGGEAIWRAPNPMGFGKDDEW
jgi:hypothetical protein